MPLKDECTRLNKVPTGSTLIYQELNNIITNSDPDNNTTSDINVDTGNVDRKAERILVTRQELRRQVYVQQLITDARNSIKHISNLRVDLENFATDSVKEAREILTGREDLILTKLRAALQKQTLEPKEIDKYLEYVHGLL